MVNEFVRACPVAETNALGDQGSITTWRRQILKLRAAPNAALFITFDLHSSPRSEKGSLLSKVSVSLCQRVTLELDHAG
jgi:hypothetical protein